MFVGLLLLTYLTNFPVCWFSRIFTGLLSTARRSSYDCSKEQVDLWSVKFSLFHIQESAILGLDTVFIRIKAQPCWSGISLARGLRVFQTFVQFECLHSDYDTHFSAFSSCTRCSLYHSRFCVVSFFLRNFCNCQWNSAMFLRTQLILHIVINFSLIS